nr:predicted GPI-anchored protein 58 [Aegilops tauschii subsp. strangulata]
MRPCPCFIPRTRPRPRPSGHPDAPLPPRPPDPPHAQAARETSTPQQRPTPRSSLRPDGRLVRIYLAVAGVPSCITASSASSCCSSLPGFTNETTTKLPSCVDRAPLECLCGPAKPPLRQAQCAPCRPPSPPAGPRGLELQRHGRPEVGLRSSETPSASFQPSRRMRSCPCFIREPAGDLDLQATPTRPCLLDLLTPLTPKPHGRRAPRARLFARTAASSASTLPSPEFQAASLRPLLRPAAARSPASQTGRRRSCPPALTAPRSSARAGLPSRLFARPSVPPAVLPLHQPAREAW